MRQSKKNKFCETNKSMTMNIHVLQIRQYENSVLNIKYIAVNGNTKLTSMIYGVVRPNRANSNNSYNNKWNITTNKELEYWLHWLLVLIVYSDKSFYNTNMAARSWLVAYFVIMPYSLYKTSIVYQICSNCGELTFRVAECCYFSYLTRRQVGIINLKAGVSSWEYCTSCWFLT